MRRLAVPNVSFSNALAESVDGIGDANIQNNYLTQISDPASIEAHYVSSAMVASLYSLPRITGRGIDPIVHGNLKKSDLTKLYTQYFVPKGKPARRIYDELKVTANGKCPLCGDIGHVRTLDHYVPKANFPLYAIVPSNLIPCCRDCNSDKLDAFSTNLDGQALHPYFDNVMFFDQKWIEARVIPGTPPVIEYFVSPPAQWTASEKSRVGAHFLEYGLSERYSVEAAADLPETLITRKTILREYSPQDYSSYLLEKSNNLNLPINNWRRVMFHCLAADGWFCGSPDIGM